MPATTPMTLPTDPTLLDQLDPLSLDVLIKNLASAIQAKLAEPLGSLDNTAEHNRQSSTPLSPSQTGSQIASAIDHTLLKPDATAADIERLCQEAKDHHFATVCVNATRISLAAALLQGSKTLPIAVIGFPLGATTSATKAFETQQAIRLGAQEIDMVLNIGALKDGNYRWVLDDIREVVQAAEKKPVKVILETSLLTDEQKIIACALAQAAGAAFVKTSTGFGGGGATVEDITLMRKVVGPEMGVKASGGVRTRADAEKMIAAGANRLGTSSGISIVGAGHTTTTGY